MKLEIYFLLSALLLSGFTVSAQEGGKVPPSVEKIASVYETKRTELCVPIVAEYKKKLQAFMISSIEKGEFATGKKVKSAIEELEKTSGLLLVPATAIVPGMWKEGNRNIFHIVNASGAHSHAKDGKFALSGDTVDTERSLGDILVFKSSCSRVWITYGPKKMCQLTQWGSSCMEFRESKKTTEPDPTAALRAEFTENCARACAGLTSKYIQNLEQAGKKEVSRGNLDAALTIRKMLEAARQQSPTTGQGFVSKWPDQRFAGTWKETTSDYSYKIDSSNTIGLYNGQGKKSKEFSYVETSPLGNVHSFRHSSGEIRVFGFADNRLFIVVPATNWRTYGTKIN